MATQYDVNNTQLGPVVIQAGVSNQTDALINTAVSDAGFYPSGAFQIPIAIGNDTGAVDLNLGPSNTQFGGQTIALYVETGSNVTVDVDTVSSFHAVVAVGDGNNVTLNDSVGGDTLVGGNQDDTLIGGAQSYLFGGSGKADLVAGGNDDTLVGGSGPESITSTTDNDTIYGGSGPETLELGGSGTSFTAGTGYAQVTLDSISHDSIYLGQPSGAQATDSVTVFGGSDSIYVGSSGGFDTINTESIASGDSLNLHIASAPGSTSVTETSPGSNVYQISYGSGSSATHITVEGKNVTLTFSDNSTQQI